MNDKMERIKAYLLAEEIVEIPSLVGYKFESPSGATIDIRETNDGGIIVLLGPNNSWLSKVTVEMLMDIYAIYGGDEDGK